MKQFFSIVCCVLLVNQFASAQANCSGFSITYSTIESRCASTGSITIIPSGGSGNYSYKVLEPQALPLTSTSTISGLAPGNYTVSTKDMETGCTIVQDNIIVGGSYSDPRFQLLKTDLTCINGTNGSVTATGLQYGREPFTYKIISPSPASVGSSNNNGYFQSLPAGDYYIQLTDSCGGIQTRTVAILDYNWSISNNAITKTNCNTVSVAITLTDNAGNTNLSGSSFDGFQYGIVNSPGDTSWHPSSTFSHSQTPLRKVTAVVKDRCSIVKSVSWQHAVPSLNASTTSSNLACNNFDVKVTNAQNFTSPQYYLKQGSSVIQSNTTGTFTAIPYGSYCIEASDNCYDTVITRCFTVNKPTPSIGASVSSSNLQCNTFTASVIGQTNLFNPVYNLYSSSNSLIASNSTGIFTGLTYGSYYINTVSSSPCYDTTISRHFTVTAPKPSVSATPAYTNQGCSSYTAAITGQTNLFNPTYCLYLNNVLIGCDPNGNFPGLSYATDYCIKVTSSSPCYDTTITVCFNQGKPQPSAGNPTSSNKGCTTFSVKIPSVANIPDPNYCLYTNANVLVDCNTTGQFDNVPYGSYYINIVTTSITTDCPNTVVKKSFSVSKPVPTVSASPIISNKTCSSFSAKFTTTNMLSPQYCLYNNNGDLIACNNNAIYNNLPYGTYTFTATNSCGEIINRTFTESVSPLAFTLQAIASCTINTTDIKVSVSSGSSPYQIKVLNPLNAVVSSQSVSSSPFTFNALPALPSGLQYRVVVISACNATDTVAVTPATSTFSRSSSVSLKCPSALSGNGSGSINIELNSNIGLYAPRIIFKNGASTSINPGVTTSLGANSARYEFMELTPATYVIEYNISSCSKKIYDTLSVAPYSFPDLKNSAAYQCDNNNFSVSAVADGGVSPFNYEIIGSNPSGPSITTPVQNNSVFDIVTNSSYSLVRMRAVDACGNGTLNDVSVLPLGQLTITSDNVDCYSNSLTLMVDTIPNASYTWYLKRSEGDSTIIATDQSYHIPYLLPTDTGVYICKTSVNNGCLMRLSYYHLKGDCSILLPVKILSFTGKPEGRDVALNWIVGEEQGMREHQIERSSGSGSFEPVGSVPATNDPARNRYSFTDKNVPAGRLRYRLKSVSQDYRITYSPVVEIIQEGISITAMPNPVKQELTISISGKSEARYDITLYNLNGQALQKQSTGSIRSGQFRLQRLPAIHSGIYLLKIVNLETGNLFTQKLIYE